MTLLSVMAPAVALLVLGVDGPLLAAPGGLLVAHALWPLLGPDIEKDTSQLCRFTAVRTQPVFGLSTGKFNIHFLKNRQKWLVSLMS